MVSEAEVERVRKDRSIWLPLAKSLLRYIERERFPSRHTCILESLTTKHWAEEISPDQARWLLDIRDDVEIVSEYRGSSLAFLIRFCHENRFGLDSEDDQIWIVELYGSRRASVPKYEARYIHGFAQLLDEAHDDWVA